MEKYKLASSSRSTILILSRYNNGNAKKLQHTVIYVIDIIIYLINIIPIILRRNKIWELIIILKIY